MRKAQAGKGKQKYMKRGKKRVGGKNKGKLVHAMVNEQQKKSHSKANPTTKIITENEIKIKKQGETDD